MGARDRWRRRSAEEKRADCNFVCDFNESVATLSDWVAYAVRWLTENASGNRSEIIYRRKRWMGWSILDRPYGKIYLLEDGRLVRMPAGSQSATEELKLRAISKASKEGRGGVIDAATLNAFCLDIFAGNPHGMFTTSDQQHFRDQRWVKTAMKVAPTRPRP